MSNRFGSPYALYYEDIDVRSILDWCSEGTEKCPKCGGTKTCMFPRRMTAASKRENPDVLDAHTGRFGDAQIDRRRLQIPLQFLGVDEGTVDVVMVDDPGGYDLPGTDEKAPPFHGVALLGENWRIYSAGIFVDPEKSEFNEKVPRFPLE
jgi:RNA polymerase subunit RPABC4/transcription elongation factor Spt4